MEENKLDVEQLKKTHAQYVFIHQVLTQSTKYSPEEFEIAQDAIKTIYNKAKELTDELNTLFPKPKDEEPKEINFEIPPVQLPEVKND